MLITNNNETDANVNTSISLERILSFISRMFIDVVKVVIVVKVEKTENYNIYNPFNIYNLSQPFSVPPVFWFSKALCSRFHQQTFDRWSAHISQIQPALFSLACL